MGTLAGGGGVGHPANTSRLLSVLSHMNTIFAPTAPAGRLRHISVFALLPALAPALPLALPAFLSAGLAAQEGVVTYTWSRQYDFDLPDGWGDGIPDSENGTTVLLFSPTASLMTPAAQEESEPSAAASDRISDRMMGMLMRIKARSPSRADQEVVRDTWTGYEQGTVVETRDFMGRTFLIEGERPEYHWRMTGEQAEHLGRMVIKATAEVDSTMVEAWFAPEIPVPGGPVGYGGLPGLILVLSVDDGRVQYFASEIALGEVGGGLIRAPEGGDRVTREEYEEIVSEKLDELERLRRRRGGGRQQDSGAGLGAGADGGNQRGFREE